MAIELLTALLLVVTAFYAYTTHQILRASQATVAVMREQAEALGRPYVEISADRTERSAPIYRREASWSTFASVTPGAPQPPD
jgi:hypothetical protein